MRARAFQIAVCRIKLLSTERRPFRKPPWTSPNKLCRSTTSVSRALRTFEKRPASEREIVINVKKEDDEPISMEQYQKYLGHNKLENLTADIICRTEGEIEAIILGAMKGHRKITKINIFMKTKIIETVTARLMKGITLRIAIKCSQIVSKDTKARFLSLHLWDHPVNIVPG